MPAVVSFVVQDLRPDDGPEVRMMACAGVPAVASI